VQSHEQRLPYSAQHRRCRSSSRGAACRRRSWSSHHTPCGTATCSKLVGGGVVRQPVGALRAAVVAVIQPADVVLQAKASSARYVLWRAKSSFWPSRASSHRAARYTGRSKSRAFVGKRTVPLRGWRGSCANRRSSSPTAPRRRRNSCKRSCIGWPETSEILAVEAPAFSSESPAAAATASDGRCPALTAGSPGVLSGR
jgi:hypothetical protein